MSSTRSRSAAGIALTYLAYAVILAVFLGPVLFMAWGSLHGTGAIATSPPDITAPASLDNYVNLFQSMDFGRYLGNSIIIAGGSTLLGLVAGAPAAYCIARLGLKPLSILTIVARMAPGVLFLIPVRTVAIRVGAIDSIPLNYVLLVLVHLIITLPMCIWLLIPFFESVPRAIEEAAEIDGCSMRRTFLTIALPMVRPGIAVAAVISFIFSWNYFLFALGLANADTVPMPVIAFNFIGVGQYDWGGLMAAAVIIAAPTTILTFVAQRFLVRGLTAGAVK